MNEDVRFLKSITERVLPLITAAAVSGLAFSAWADLYDRGGGLIYDDGLNLMWLQDANAGAGSLYDDGVDPNDGRMTWQSAMDWASDLNYGGVNDWRLATVAEMDHMYYVSLGNPPAGPLAYTDPFFNLQSDRYWSNTTQQYFNFSNGKSGQDGVSTPRHGWAVRDAPEGGTVAVEQPATLCDGVAPIPTPPLGGGGLIFITHGWRWSTPDQSWIDDMKDYVVAKVDGSEWKVFSCHWDGGVNSPFASIAVARGEILGNAIGSELAQTAYDRIHFIGHSAGAWLVDGAAAALRHAGWSGIIHTTFLDAYTPAGSGEYWLGRDSTWAEHYADAGIPFTQPRLRAAYNIDITDAVPGEGGHSWPHRWYDWTIQDDSRVTSTKPWGFFQSEEMGVSVANLHNSHKRGAKLVFGAGGGLQEVPLAFLETMLFDWISDPTITGMGVEVLSETDVLLTTQSPAWLVASPATSRSFDTVLFDHEFLSGAQGVLSLQLGTEVVFVADERFTEPGVHGETVWLGEELPPGRYSVAFRVDPYGPMLSQVRISNVRFALAQDPSQLPLLSGHTAVWVLALVICFSGVCLECGRRSTLRCNRSGEQA